MSEIVALIAASGGGSCDASTILTLQHGWADVRPAFGVILHVLFFFRYTNFQCALQLAHMPMIPSIVAFQRASEGASATLLPS